MTNYPQPPFQPPPFQPPPPYGYPPQQSMMLPQGNGMATAAMILGIVSLIMPPLGLVAVILGIIALTKASKPGVGGHGKAIAGVITGALALLIIPAILLPALNRAREQANRIKCASNLRQIALGVTMYSNDNKSWLPRDLEMLGQVRYIASADVFICPASNDSPATGDQWEKQLKHGSGCCSYVYVGPHVRSLRLSGRTVVVHEPLEAHGGEGINVAFLDGSVEWYDKKKATAIVSELKAGQNPAPSAGP